MLLTARSISKTHSLRSLFSGVTITIDAGERIGLIGPNGAGKSTLLRLLAGIDEPDDGSIVATKGLRAVYVPQQDLFPDDMTARAVLTEAALDGLSGDGGMHDEHEAETHAGMILDRMGFDDAHSDAATATLSGGWRKRLSIARALAQSAGSPDLMLLDEPTNHLDVAGIQWLEEFVRRSSTTGNTFATVFVTHDRQFLESGATRIVELSAAYPTGTLDIQGNYTEFIRRKEEFLEGRAKAERAMANQVRQDLAWLHRRAKARRTKSQSRIDASHERIDELATLRARNSAAAAAGAGVDFVGTDRRTRKLITAIDIAKSYDARTLFSGITLSLGVGDCLGLLGPNGSGKTTLIRVLTGETTPDAGTVTRCDPPPRVAVFSQHRRDFDPGTLLRDALCPVSDQVRFRGHAMHITAWSRRFLFRDDQLEQPVGSLSGGELARIHLARIMLEPADVLVLDEPTNDLDIPTLEMLEEALEDFPGALILVTHDRAMLDRLATSVLALDGRGGAAVFATLGQALVFQSPPAAQPGRAPRQAAPESLPAAAQPPAPKRKKLSFNEQREYDTIEQRIAEAEAGAAAAEARLSDPQIMSDHTRMAAACEDLTKAQARVAALYARWEELDARMS